jgi:hypothetical protein
MNTFRKNILFTKLLYLQKKSLLQICVIFSLEFEFFGKVNALSLRHSTRIQKINISTLILSKSILRKSIN